MFDFAHEESLRFVNAMVAVAKLCPVPARHTFRSFFGRIAGPRVWQVGHWRGGVHSNT